MSDLFREKLRGIPPRLRSRLRYYRDFVSTPALKLRAGFAPTECDKLKDLHVEALRQATMANPALVSADSDLWLPEGMAEYNSSNYAACGRGKAKRIEGLSQGG